MLRKDLIIVAIATFCLTATLFLIVPTKSQTGVGEYNPWADYNEDGKINILDIVPAAISFGASGDATKNVSVTNWPTDKPVLPEILRFYGVRRRLSDPTQFAYQNSLADHVEIFENLEMSIVSPFTLLPGQIAVLTNIFMVSEDGFAKTVLVNGTAKIRWGYISGGGDAISHNVTLYLQKIKSDGSIIDIGAKYYMNIRVADANYSGYVYMSITETFYPGDKLALGILDVGRNLSASPVSNQVSTYFCYYQEYSGLFSPRFSLFVELPITQTP